MAKLNAWRCDRADCQTVAEAKDNYKPTGWLTMRVEGNGNDSSSLTYCSNECLAMVAIERYEQATGELWGKKKTQVSKRPSSPAQRESARRAGITNWHDKGKGHPVPNPDCYKCEAILQEQAAVIQEGQPKAKILRETECFS